MPVDRFSFLLGRFTFEGGETNINNEHDCVDHYNNVAIGQG